MQRVARPWVWGILNLPFGITSGFVTVMLGFLLKKQGMSDYVIGSIGALNLFPHVWKFVYAPIADSTLTRKKWYVLANGASFAAILGIAFVPITLSNVDFLKTLILINSFAIALLGMAVEGLMAHGTPPELRGRAAGWFQAGNLGGSGLGGGLGLMLAERTSTKLAFMVIAGVTIACTLALFLVPEAPRILERDEPKPSGPARFVAALRMFGRSLVAVVKDLFRMLASRNGIVAIALVSLPIGSGALQYLFSGDIATLWGADADLVAITTGLAGGVISAAGCVAGGWLSDRAGRRLAYVLGGVILAVIALVWAFSPRTPAMYAVFTLLYQFGTGIAFGCFTGFVLEVIGTGAAATKYNVFASLSNVPIMYMAALNGWASTHYGSVSMLYVDAGSEVIGIVIFLFVLAVVRPGRAKSASSAPPPT